MGEAGQGSSGIAVGKPAEGEVGDKRVKLQAAHTKLAHSRAFVVRAYRLQTHEMLFDALAEAFRVLGGVARRGIFDNMRTAVDRVGTALPAVR